MKKFLTFIFVLLAAGTLQAQVTTTAKLDGTKSYDPDGTIVKYSWVKEATSPAGGDLATPQAATSIISNLVQGVYKYDFTVTDNEGATATRIVTVTVTANKVPVASADDLNVRITSAKP